MSAWTMRRAAVVMAAAAMGAGAILAGGCKHGDRDTASDLKDSITNDPHAPPANPQREPGPGDASAAEPNAAATKPNSGPTNAASAEPAPRQLDPQTDPEEVDGWRPAWWLEDPMKTQQHGVACAYATDPELSKARTIAVDYARQRLTQMLGHEPRSTEMKTDALKLPSGEYRAFVLIQTPLK